MGIGRVQKTIPATLTHTWSVGATATDPTGTPTVAVVAADGVAVQSGNATIVGGSTGQTTFGLNAVATLEYLTVTWTATVAGVSRTEVDYVEVVDGYYFSLAEGRGSDSQLSSVDTYPNSAVETARLEVEAECEEICDRAFIRRYARVVLDGTGLTDLLLAHPSPTRSPADVRTIRSITMAPTLDGTFTAFTAAQLAAVAVLEDSTLRRTDGAAWTAGARNVIIEYEYGLDAPPVDLRRAALLRLRSRLFIHRSPIPDRATSFVSDGGGTFRIDLPGAYKVGIPEVDGPYSRYSRRPNAGVGGGQPRPVSRTLTYGPQRYSLFHR